LLNAVTVAAVRLAPVCAACGSPTRSNAPITASHLLLWLHCQPSSSCMLLALQQQQRLLVLTLTLTLL
jgi:hypothetical protein